MDQPLFYYVLSRDVSVLVGSVPIGIWVSCVCSGLWALGSGSDENLNERMKGRRGGLSTVVSSKFDSAERKMFSTHEPLSANAFLHGDLGDLDRP